MRQDGEIEVGQVDASGPRVFGQDVRVVAGIEEDALAAVFDQRRESPVLLHLRRFAEGVVEDGDLLFRRVPRGRRRRRRRGAAGKEQKQCEVATHRSAPTMCTEEGDGSLPRTLLYHHKPGSGVVVTNQLACLTCVLV